jgi:hypothetical protein
MFMGISTSFAISNSIILTLNATQASSGPLTLSRFGTDGLGTAKVPLTTAQTFANAMTLNQGAKLQIENTLNGSPATTVNAGVLSGNGSCEIKSSVTSGSTMRNKVFGNNTGFTGEIILSGSWSRFYSTPGPSSYYDTQFDTYQSLGAGVLTLDGQGFWLYNENNSESLRVLATLNILGHSYLNGSSGRWYWFSRLTGNGNFSTGLGSGGAIFTASCTNFGGTLISGATHTWQFGGGSYRILVIMIGKIKNPCGLGDRIYR